MKAHGITVENILRNPSASKLYEEALRNEKGSAIASSGALVALSGARTGRSPGDKRIVAAAESYDRVWWGDVNVSLDLRIFEINRERAIDYFNTRERLFVIDGYAGWDARHRIKVRVICERAYHALFMRNMLIRPSASELADFDPPDYVIYNAGRFPANSRTSGMTSKTSVEISLASREIVILGTEYAGEMKKGVFTIMNWLMPQRGVLPMHCSANEGAGGDVSLFFGLSGTGKTTLSADPKRRLIGDDEHCWTDEGIFNIEGGCYAKVINLSTTAEPEIARAIRFGTVLENVVLDDVTRKVDYANSSITENTRASYPIEFIENAKIPCVGGHPANIIFLTADAFGVLPPVSRLDPETAMRYFLCGYTAKVAGTEMGVKEPKAVFSPCFGAPFLVLRPEEYARLLRERITEHKAEAWLINTGWTGGPYGVGSRIALRHTRAIIDAIHDGGLSRAAFAKSARFGLEIPKSCPGVPAEILSPRGTWANAMEYDAAAAKLAELFLENSIALEEVVEYEPA